MELQDDITLFLPSGAFIATYPAGYFLGDAYGSYVCDYGDDSGDYSVVAIAGTENYFLTNRPPATSGGSYAGDLQISFSAWENIQTVLDSLNSNIFYYAMGYDIDGDYRYYMTPSGYSNTYYVCNSAGQLYYYLKDEGGSGGSGGGSDFDATEVITAINSVYDAIEYGFYDVCDWLDGIQEDIRSLNTDVILLSQNMVSGFSDLANIGNNIVGKLATLDTRLTYVGANVVNSVDDSSYYITNSIDTYRTLFNDYFYSLGKKYPQLMTVRLSGNDNLFDWDSGDILQNIEVEKADTGDTVTVHRGFSGTLGSGVSPLDVSIFNSIDGYNLIYDTNDNVTIKCVAANGYNRFVYPNLCLNSDFRTPSNSNGQTIYTAQGETINSWSIVGETTTVTVYDGYLNLSTSSIDEYNHFHTFLPVDYEVGTTYTFSALVRVNSLTGTFRIRAVDRYSGLGVSNSSVLIPVTDDFSIVTGTFTVGDTAFTSAALEFLVYPNSVVDADILAVKVEQSSSQSLAFPDYNNEWHFFSDVYTPPSPIISLAGTEYPLSVSLSFVENQHDYIFYDNDVSFWKVYRYSSNRSFVLSSSDQFILNQTIYTPPASNNISLSDFNLSTAPPLFYDGVNTIDITGNAVVTIDYYHDGTWFDYIYSAMETQIQLLTDLDIVNETIVNIENTIVDISPDNDAYNIFYIEKEDGTHESIGDAAMDVAKVVGDALSMFYRLVFEDALSNKGILSDFEDTMSGTVVGVDVWS